MAKPTLSNRVIAALAPAGRLARDDPPQLGHREIGRHLLDLALDPRLLGIFDEHVGAVEDFRVELGLAGAIAADGVDVDAGADHVVGEDARAAPCRPSRW